VLAADREPGLSAVSELLRERARDAARAAGLLGRVVGARRTLLAILAPFAAEARSACAERGVEVLELPPEYPQTLEPMVAERAGDTGAAVIPLETALAGLDASVGGKIQASKVLTVIGPDGTPRGNYRVPLGARLRDVLDALRLHAGGRDKVVAGGPMRGLAQYSLDAAVDTSVDAILLIRPESIVPWSDEPCVNCGACIDACPRDLQVQLLGRYSEFSLFERTQELDIDSCFECGLCATVCTARRPLLQLIRLAKRELAGANGSGS
jgi:electron transport complex protein RnfC